MTRNTKHKGDRLPVLQHPQASPVEGGELGRREMFKLLGASIALAQASACDDHEPLLLARVHDTETGFAHETLEFATSMDHDGFATGLIAKCRGGRPIKLDGNPEHPSSLGAAGVLEQASILNLYDPERADAVLARGEPSSWSAFASSLPPTAARLWFVLHPQSSPLTLDLVQRIQQRYPEARFVYASPLARRNTYRGTARLFGQAVEPIYDFTRASCVLSLDADFTATGPNCLRYARQFAEHRRLTKASDSMNRLYVVESMPSPTGSLADHHMRTTPRRIAAVAAATLAALRAPVARGVSPAEILGEVGLERQTQWIELLAKDLTTQRSSSIVIAGPRQPPHTHVLAQLMNHHLGNVGATVRYIEPVVADPEQTTGLADLAEAIRREQVDGVVILGPNPVYHAPAELEFGSLLRRVPYRVHLSQYFDETSAECAWFIPRAHYLETWADCRACDGTVSLCQPVLQDMSHGKAVSQVLAAFAGAPHAETRSLLEDYWLRRFEGPDVHREWQMAVQLGFLPGTERASLDVQPSIQSADAAYMQARRSIDHLPGTVELNWQESLTVSDGRYANNAWLQELPQPITKLSWDNAALLGPATASVLGVATGDVISMARSGREIRGPVMIVPGHAEDCVTVHVGFGRLGSEGVASQVGFDVFPLLTTAAHGDVTNVELRATTEKHALALEQLHFDDHGREIARYGSLAEYRAHPESFGDVHEPPPASILPDIGGDPAAPQWAMAIDTSVCTGCAACVIACQAENNIPVVGKDGMQMGRGMLWLRIDEYRYGPSEAPRRVHQPMMCQHCEEAPCEYVCPVYATTHSADGLNEMTYNRCIGTRFCSNNCPYKVRRFNWFDYTGNQGDRRTLQYNPEVTVRGRGVMEKCTFCVQRIRRYDIEQARSAVTGGMALIPTTACAQTCPTGAIRFGNQKLEESDVVQWGRQPRSYAVLRDLGTRPRVRYLAKIFNTHPET